MAQCQTACLASFDSETKTVVIKNTLNFFSDEIKFFKCQAYIGLTNDGQVVAENINLYNYKLTGSILLSDEDYYSHHALPDDWYELFLPEGEVFGDENDRMNQVEKQIDKIIADLDFKVVRRKE